MNRYSSWRSGTSLFGVLFFIQVLLPAQNPEFPEIDNYIIDKGYPVYTPENLWNYIDGAADSYNAMGFRDLHIATYNRGKHSIKLEVYHHASENLAFGMYALERAPSYDFFDLGVQSYHEEGLVHFLKGEYYVKITTNSDKKKILGSLQELAVRTEAVLEGTGEFPAVLSLFPEKGKQANTEMYIAENVLGHEFLHNAFRTNYNVDNNRFTIYLFSDNTESENNEMLSRYLSLYNLSPGDDPGGKFYFEDGYNGNIYLAWEKGLVIIISGLRGDNTELANEFINKITEKK